MQLAIDLGKKIKEVREAHRLSQVDFAESLGVRQKSVSYWETGRSLIATKHLYDVCIKYKVPIAHFDVKMSL